jgi:hypothetical protein
MTKLRLIVPSGNVGRQVATTRADRTLIQDRPRWLLSASGLVGSPILSRVPRRPAKTRDTRSLSRCPSESVHKRG